MLQEGIAYYERNEISEIMNKQNFSVLIDESTDRVLNRYKLFVIRYWMMK